MEAGRALERHVASVHRGMVFLQREHLTLLAGLHVEIRQQQVSCDVTIFFFNLSALATEMPFSSF
uniref:CCDC92/74 N-terminal domain-containing protein n=1 Tax=Hippocampus comes TaxID=109280 RepID=A0A3Q2XRA0_HIPCM